MNTNFYCLWFDATGNRTWVYRFSSRCSILSISDHFMFILLFIVYGNYLSQDKLLYYVFVPKIYLTLNLVCKSIKAKIGTSAFLWFYLLFRSQIYKVRAYHKILLCSISSTFNAILAFQLKIFTLWIETVMIRNIFFLIKMKTHSAFDNFCLIFKTLETFYTSKIIKLLCVYRHLQFVFAFKFLFLFQLMKKLVDIKM